MDKVFFMSEKFQNKYRIESTRKPEWDYSWSGWYFVTICTKNREHHFGKIVNGKMKYSTSGQIAHECWLDLPNHYLNCILGEFIIMPNHVHGVITIDYKSNVETGLKPVSTEEIKHYSLFEIIRGFKTFSSRKINDHFRTPGRTLWQPRFHDRIIRNEFELSAKVEYILNNPARWEEDNNNPKNIK